MSSAFDILNFKPLWEILVKLGIQAILPGGTQKRSLGWDRVRATNMNVITKSVGVNKIALQGECVDVRMNE